MEFDDSLIVTPYSPISATKTMRASPRFGHSRNFSVLFYDDKDDQKDYVLGLIFGACLVLSLFLVWSILLVLFKCLKRTKRFGLLSGEPMVGRPGDLEKYGRPFFVRFSFLLCILVFISFAVTLVTRGITKIQDTVTTLLRSIDEVDTMQEEVDKIVVTLEELSGPIKDMEERVIKLYGSGSFCPNDSTLAESTGFDFQKLVNEVVVFLEEVGFFLEKNVTEIEEASNQTAEAVASVSDTAENIELDDWQSLIVLVPYVFVPSFLLVALILAWFDASVRWYTCVVEWLLLPLLMLFTAIAFSAAASVLILAVANADFCEGEDSLGRISKSSPDHSVADFLASTGLTDSALIVRMVQFYVSQCTADDPFSFLEQYRDVINTTVEERTTLADAMSNVTLGKLTLDCGRDFTALDAILLNLESNLDVILKTVQAGIDLLGCDRIALLYSKTFYSGTCTLSVTGVTWLFVSSLIIGVMGMLLLTLRSAMWDVVQGEESVLGSYAMGVPAPFEEADKALETRLRRGGEQQPTSISLEGWKDSQSPRREDNMRSDADGMSLSDASSKSIET